MKELLSGKCNLKNDEKNALAEECNAIVQMKLSPKLTNPGRFTITYSISSLTIRNTFRDLGVRVNMMLWSMMKKFTYGEPKSTQMMLTLADIKILYPYEILEDVPVRVDDLVFSADCAILDMPEHS